MLFYNFLHFRQECFMVKAEEPLQSPSAVQTLPDFSATCGVLTRQTKPINCYWNHQCSLSCNKKLLSVWNKEMPKSKWLKYFPPFQKELTQGNVKHVTITRPSSANAVEVISNKVIYRVTDNCLGPECRLKFTWPYAWEGTWNFQCNHPETSLIRCNSEGDALSKGRFYF